MQFIDLKTQYQKIKQPILDRITQVLEHGQYINGPELKELEEELMKFTGAKHALGCASGTDALLLAYMALGIGPGDEIITTPFTFFATAETALLLGIKLVFADINPETYNLDPEKIESKITSKTKAIVPVSLYGQCAELEKIGEIASKHGLAVIEDAAQSLGAKTAKGNPSCSYSTISCTSFFPAKPLGAYGDAGAVFTNDADLDKAMRELKEHGQSGRYHHTRVGINGRLDSIQAAILLEKLKIFPKEIELREKVAKRYDDLLGDKVKRQSNLDGFSNVYAQYTIEVENREDFVSRMNRFEVPTSIHYPTPLHLQPIMKDQGYKQGDFPLSEQAAKRVISLPMHPYLSLEDQDKVVAAVLESL